VLKALVEKVSTNIDNINVSGAEGKNTAQTMAAMFALDQ